MSQTVDLNNEDEDTFERDLKEMLKEGPSLNDLSSTVQGGGGNVGKDPQAKPQAYIRPDNAQATRFNPSIPRSHSVPPGEPNLDYCGTSNASYSCATSNIPLSSPERNGKGQISPDKASPLMSPNSSKIETIKQWTMNTYKCTRQMVSERFGKASRTVDLELEGQIESLRDMQRKYSNILRLARALANHFYHVVQTQRALGDCFADMSQKNPELQEEFSYNSETQKALCKNGETLLSALNFFISSVNTLCNKTMDDTLQTIRQYENARIEFDAYRSDLDGLQLGPRDSTTMPRIDDAQRKFDNHREKYERLRGDVAIKLKFLDENRVTVTRRQLYLLYKAFQAYTSGSHEEMDALVRQFNIKMDMYSDPASP